MIGLLIFFLIVMVIGVVVLGVFLMLTKPNVHQLIHTLKNGDVPVREAAAESLGILGDPQAVEPLVEALDDKSSVRYAAAFALAKFRDKRAHERLADALSYYRSDVVQLRKATGALSQLNDERAVLELMSPSWTSSLTSEQKGLLRKAADDALVQMRPVEVFAKMLVDKDRSWRQRDAAEWLEKFGDARGTEWLQHNPEPKYSPEPVKKSFASCATRSNLFDLSEEVKCRCYYSLEDLAESFHALSRIYKGRIETRKTTNGGMCPYLLVIEASEIADKAALQIDKQFGSKWGDYHIMPPGKIYDQSKPLER